MLLRDAPDFRLGGSRFRGFSVLDVGRSPSSPADASKAASQPYYSDIKRPIMDFTVPGKLTDRKPSGNSSMGQIGLPDT